MPPAIGCGGVQLGLIERALGALRSRLRRKLKVEEGDQNARIGVKVLGLLLEDYGFVLPTSEVRQMIAACADLTKKGSSGMGRNGGQIDSEDGDRKVSFEELLTSLPLYRTIAVGDRNTGSSSGCCWVQKNAIKAQRRDPDINIMHAPEFTGQCS